MADIRNPVAGSSLLPQPRVAPVRSEAIRAAQRAFFEAALTGAADARDATPATAPQTSSAGVSRADVTSPNRILRPGSLVDIKV